MFKKKDERFTEMKAEGISGTIIVDEETGVNYLFYKSGYAGGLTPLLDKDGKVIVGDVIRKQDN